MPTSNTFNPLDGLTADQVIALINQLIVDQAPLSHEDLCEREDRLDAIIPALVELRDEHHQPLTFLTIAEAESLDWFFEAAEDDRLSPETRQNRIALRDRYVVQGVRKLLGYLPGISFSGESDEGARRLTAPQGAATNGRYP
ncbi:MAG: hypothetical protein F8N36_12020 [Desulfovibrio sp.]|uniref:hypothetical protein n=1 Tax=Desulfovibrio sp. TaxID=885 RepID=UPI00135D3321|nr:hypothetical protein [Desulfovibrio sp.]MTJ93574.1 hypothetical protein [Desulfovibrio sp.]